MAPGNAEAAGDAAHAGSGIGRVDPRVRLAAAAAFAASVALLQRPEAVAAALALATSAVVLARLPWRMVGRRLLALDAFMLVVLATLPFTVPGEPMAVVAGLPVSREGAVQAALIAGKANAALLMLLALLATLPAATVAQALQRLGAPLALVGVFVLACRYVHVVAAEHARLRRAMTARGFRPRTDRHTWRSFGWLIGMLLVRSVEQAERVHAAMRCRGFTGRFPGLAVFRLCALDGLFAGMGAAALALLLWLECA